MRYLSLLLTRNSCSHGVLFTLQGLYRVSGVKSKVERLCQSFELGGEVDLSEHHPNVISNVLKLYLRQVRTILGVCIIARVGAPGVLGRQLITVLRRQFWYLCSL